MRRWIWQKEAHSKQHLLPFATRKALCLARLCGQLWAGPPHPPCPHSSSKNVSTLSNTKKVHERAATALWSQTNLSVCQGRNSGRPPFPSSLSLCMETHLPLVICLRLKLISLAPRRPLLGNNIGFSFGLLGGRRRAGRKLCAFSSSLELCAGLGAQLSLRDTLV